MSLHGAGERPLSCLVVAPSATQAALRQSEALFDMALRGALREHDVAERWAKKLADPVASAETPRQEVEGVDFVLAEVSVLDPVVLLYLGIAHAVGTPVVALRRAGGGGGELVRRVVSELLEYELTALGLSELNIRLRDALRHLAERRALAALAPASPLAARGATAGADDGWRDLAFTATHSIGNSIFPVEVYLGHLLEITRREGLRDGAVAAERALANLEKAKVQVERFKSLAADTEPHPRAIDLLEAVVARVDYLERRGVGVSLFDDGAAAVHADPMLLDECLDELVNNALLWLDGRPEPRISVTLGPGGLADLPPRLAGDAGRYLLLRFEDNGPGVAAADKERIFDLFFSTHPQGKGIGLAAMRKNLRRMGGEVREAGLPGVGARFEVFLPRARSGT